MVDMIPDQGGSSGGGSLTSLAWPRTVPILTDAWITLREWTSADADGAFAACQDADTQCWMDIPVPYLREHAVDFVGQQSRAQWSSQRGAPFAITATGADQLLGSCGLVGVTAEHLVAEVVCGVAQWARGRNVATRAVRLLCDWAFSDVGLARLEFYIEPSNVASRALAARLGCQFEGTLRSKALIHGARRDMALYALLK